MRCPSPATPPTPPASSTWLPAPIRNGPMENGVKYFSVASGGGTGRTLHPDNVAAGPASYGLTDSMGRMHGDAQFAGSSSRARARGDDGPDRHGQQPHGGRHRGLRRGCQPGVSVPAKYSTKAAAAPCGAAAVLCSAALADGGAWGGISLLQKGKSAAAGQPAAARAYRSASAATLTAEKTSR